MQAGTWKDGGVIRGVRVRRGQSAGVSEVFEIFRRTVIRAAEEEVGYKVYGKGKKGSTRWTDEIKKQLGRKRKCIQVDATKKCDWR